MANSDICILLNVKSGKRDKAEIPQRIAAAFEALGVPITLRRLHRGGEVEQSARQAVQDGFSTIVAAGGDGTICGVASAMADSGRVMGILPLGTFNYFARSLDIPEALEDAAQVIVQGAHRPTRVATINDELFLNNASLGAYPLILRERETIYRRWGRSRVAAYWSVLKTLATLHHRLDLTVTADGVTQRFRTPLVFAVNNAYQLDQMGLQGRDAIAAGKLVLLIAPDTGRWGTLGNALALAAGRARRDRNFDLVTGTDITIDAPRISRHVARDGERGRMKPPFRLRVHEDALTLITPQAATRGPR